MSVFTLPSVHLSHFPVTMPKSCFVPASSSVLPHLSVARPVPVPHCYCYGSASHAPSNFLPIPACLHLPCPTSCLALSDSPALSCPLTTPCLPCYSARPESTNCLAPTAPLCSLLNLACLPHNKACSDHSALRLVLDRVQQDSAEVLFQF